MKAVAVAVILLLAGCATPVPVKQTWPEAPTVLMEQCPQLKQLGADQGTLRDLLMVVIENYAAYYHCAGRTQSWQEWYRQQQKIFTEANK